MASEATRVRRLRFSPGEGHLYRREEDFFLVYCGASRLSWDVCPTDARGESFQGVLVFGAVSREAAVERLRAIGPRRQLVRGQATP
jgi:hypothetical protein